MLNNLDAYLSELKRLAAVDKHDFLANRDMLGNAKYHFVIAIEVCLDVANHIIASERYRVPRDNADTFKVLIEEGVLGKERRDNYSAMARFRNRLVHLYWDVNNDLLYQYLQSGLVDLDAFAQSVSAFLGRRSGPR